MAKTHAGRPSIFRGKVKSRKTTVWAILTKEGARAFERARKQLALVVELSTGRKVARPSDGDTVEFLARGEDETVKYLAPE